MVYIRDSAFSKSHPFLTEESQEVTLTIQLLKLSTSEDVLQSLMVEAKKT